MTDPREEAAKHLNMAADALGGIPATDPMALLVRGMINGLRNTARVLWEWSESER